MNRRRLPRLTTAKDILNDKGDVTHLLILRFQQMLADGVLSPGTKLPPERELAAHFKVARSSLRQALKVLEIMGVITQKVGRRQLLEPGCVIGAFGANGVLVSAGRYLRAGAYGVAIHD